MNPSSITITLQRRRDAALADHLYDSAAFWADKVLTITNAVADAHALADVYFCTHQFSRAISCLQSNNRIQQSLACRILAVRAYLEMERADKAWEVIAEAEHDAVLQQDPVPQRPHAVASEAVFEHLKGVVLLRQHRTADAKDHLLAALRIDEHCYDAFHAILQHHLLSPAEERQLVRSTTFHGSATAGDGDGDGDGDDGGGDDSELAKLLYLIKTSKHGDAKEIALAEQLLKDRYRLGANTDVQYSKAETYYAQGFVQQAHDVLRHILRFDMHNLDVVPLFARCLVEMRDHNALYRLGHDLVDNYSQHPVSWYTVGCYYQSIGDTQLAKQYLFKATEKDDTFVPAWLTFLEISAQDKEFDAALTVYSHITKALPRSHLPKLYIARAYRNHGQMEAALSFHSQAFDICKDDPVVCKEYGELLLWKGQYESALEKLTMARRLLYAASERAHLLGQTYLSLSRVYIRLNNSSEARTSVQRAIALMPTFPDAHAVLGDLQAADDQLDAAIESYHKALRDNADNVKVTDSLNTVLSKKHQLTSLGIDGVASLSLNAFDDDIDNDDWMPHILGVVEDDEDVEE
ncbi:anaphase-promoting complex subunit Cut9 [Sorochytrium milnesiophthora]